MRAETQRTGFFDCDVVIGKRLGAAETWDNVLEFGCGDGSFTVPAARRTHGLVTMLDIEPAMITVEREKAASLELHNVRAELRILSRKAQV